MLAGSHDLLQVRLEHVGGAKEAPSASATTALIPFVKEIVPVVDRGSRRIEVDPPEGLLDIQGLVAASAAAQPAKKRRRRRRQLRTPAGSAAAHDSRAGQL